MHVTKNDIPARIDVPGATARHLAGFGSASGPMAAEYFTLGAGTDIAPLLEGLPGDACQTTHWGYVLGGELVVSYVGGATERCTGGDLFHWPAGHTVRVETDAELILFSPAGPHAEVMDHMLERMQTA